MQGKKVIVPSIRWVVRNVERIKIREDCWLPRGVIRGSANKEDPIHVADLIDKEDVEWKERIISDLLDSDITQKVLAIPLNARLWKINWFGLKPKQAFALDEKCVQ